MRGAITYEQELTLFFCIGYKIFDELIIKLVDGSEADHQKGHFFFVVFYYKPVHFFFIVLIFY